MLLEILIVTDHHLGELIVPGIKQIRLGEGEGFLELGDLAANQELVFLDVKVLFVITGFAEVQARHPALGSCVLAALKKLDGNIWCEQVILAAPLPQFDTSRALLKDLFQLSRQLQNFCAGHARYEYTKTGLLFYGPGGVYANLLERTELTASGKKVLVRQVLDKLHSCGHKVAC